MSHETDSFIDEVTEEVRRDRLFALFRRFGWIALAIILIIVAGTAWREYSQAQSRAAAQAWGDAVLAAQRSENPAAALMDLDPAGSTDRAALGALLAAGAQDDKGAVISKLETAANEATMVLAEKMDTVSMLEARMFSRLSSASDPKFSAIPVGM